MSRQTTAAPFSTSLALDVAESILDLHQDQEDVDAVSYRPFPPLYELVHLSPFNHEDRFTMNGHTPAALLSPHPMAHDLARMSQSPFPDDYDYCAATSILELDQDEDCDDDPGLPAYDHALPSSPPYTSVEALPPMHLHQVSLPTIPDVDSTREAGRTPSPSPSYRSDSDTLPAEDEESMLGAVSTEHEETDTAVHSRLTLRLSIARSLSPFVPNFDHSCLDALDELLLTSPADSFADVCYAASICDAGSDDMPLSRIASPTSFASISYARPRAGKAFNRNLLSVETDHERALAQATSDAVTQDGAVDLSTPMRFYSLRALPPLPVSPPPQPETPGLSPTRVHSPLSVSSLSEPGSPPMQDFGAPFGAEPILDPNLEQEVALGSPRLRTGAFMLSSWDEIMEEEAGDHPAHADADTNHVQVTGEHFGYPLLSENAKNTVFAYPYSLDADGHPYIFSRALPDPTCSVHCFPRWVDDTGVRKNKRGPLSVLTMFRGWTATVR